MKSPVSQMLVTSIQVTKRLSARPWHIRSDRPGFMMLVSSKRMIVQGKLGRKHPDTQLVGAQMTVVARGCSRRSEESNYESDRGYGVNS